ncbi:uncharacterized protein LOC122282393 [Carya illinoinensis]|uniref:uncharacterized protein LOC122282393 n=1 Tax=Carya illinoinensis TaxID=32201 RepID=UPI001C725E48|nr:uncharacterized protein LOC122282393 [Carya illinoinensis]
MTPFEALYGVPPPTLLQYAAGTTQNEAVDSELRSREEILSLLRKNLLAAQSTMKQQYDKKHVYRQFQVSDMVYLKLQKYKQHTVGAVVNPKLAARYCGPFKVLECIGTVAYRLELPPTSAIHPVFHVSRLKKHVGPLKIVSSALPLQDSHGAIRTEPEKVLQRRMTPVDNKPFIELLIKWRGASEADATWVPVEQLRLQYPDLVGSLISNSMDSTASRSRDCGDKASDPAPAEASTPTMACTSTPRAPSKAASRPASRAATSCASSRLPVDIEGEDEDMFNEEEEMADVPIEQDRPPQPSKKR